jgi:hypothetical protein
VSGYSVRMSQERKIDIVEAALHKRWWSSTTFLATVFTELCLTACFSLVLWTKLDAELTTKVLSSLVLAITFVAIAFIAPKIAHDALTRIPAVKGLYDPGDPDGAPPDQ